MEDTLKKLLLYNITHSEQEQKAPFTPKEEKGILKQYSEPDFTDSVTFALTKTNAEPGKLFSRLGLERFLHNLRIYVGARILGNYNKTQKEPEVLLVHIQVEHLTKKEYEERIKNESDHS